MVMLSQRSRLIQPFHVMRLLARARELEQQGQDVVHMEVGEPDFNTPSPVIAAAQAAIASGKMHYTAATGLPELQRRIALHYKQQYDVNLEPGRIVITPGSSGALLLSLACLIEPGKKLMLADPGYPCNRNFGYFLDAGINAVTVDANSNYQLTAELIKQNWDAETLAVILASPSNPTGTLINDHELRRIVDTVAQLNGFIIMDEIYHGLVYGQEAASILQYSQQAFVINSFSKYYGMTGWRVGWCVVPEAYLQSVNNLAQNIFLAAPTPSQYAALAVFENDTHSILEQRRQQFKQRRDYLLPAVRELGFKVTSEPQGAFYIYADCSDLTDDSMTFCQDLLEAEGVAITPGLDFGEYRQAQHVRFAYTTSLDRLQEGVNRLRRFISRQHAASASEIP